MKDKKEVTGLEFKKKPLRVLNEFETTMVAGGELKDPYSEDDTCNAGGGSGDPGTGGGGGSGASYSCGCSAQSCIGCAPSYTCPSGTCPVTTTCPPKK
jgi:hypothetical protein